MNIDEVINFINNLNEENLLLLKKTVEVLIEKRQIEKNLIN